MGRWGLAILCGAVLLALSGCGCGSEDRLGPVETVTVDGTLVEKEGRVLTFVTAEQRSVEILLFSGRTWPLKVGDRYLVTAWENEGRLVARMDGHCSDSTIRHADGSFVDASYRGWIEAKLVSFVIYGGIGFVAVILVWGAARVARRTLESVD